MQGFPVSTLRCESVYFLKIQGTLSFPLLWLPLISLVVVPSKVPFFLRFTLFNSVHARQMPECQIPGRELRRRTVNEGSNLKKQTKTSSLSVVSGPECWGMLCNIENSHVPGAPSLCHCSPSVGHRSGAKLIFGPFGNRWKPAWWGVVGVSPWSDLAVSFWKTGIRWPMCYEHRVACVMLSGMEWYWWWL